MPCLFLNNVFKCSSRFSHVSLLVSLTPSILRLHLLEKCSNSTSLASTNSGSNWYAWSSFIEATESRTITVHLLIFSEVLSILTIKQSIWTHIYYHSSIIRDDPPTRFYLTGEMTNLYPFIQAWLEWRFRELFFSNVPLYKQFQYIAFKSFSCRLLIISYEMLIITETFNETANELTIYAAYCRWFTKLISYQ